MTGACMLRLARDVGVRIRRSIDSRAGMNMCLRGLHKLARNCFIIWRSCGTPRQGEEFELMRWTRLQFKYALRYVKQHETVMHKYSLANKLAEEVVRAVQKLDTGKSAGLDGIFAQHLLYCSQRLLTMLALWISCFLFMGFPQIVGPCFPLFLYP